LILIVLLVWAPGVAATDVAEPISPNSTVGIPVDLPAPINNTTAVPTPAINRSTERINIPADKIIKQSDREVAADKGRSDYEKSLLDRVVQPDPGGVPHYFGPFANWANSPMPKGPVLDITVESGGAGYTAPTVQIVDVYETSTANATASAVVVGGAITQIVVTSGGADYTAPRVIITDPTGTGATATANLDTSRLTGGIHKFVSPMPSIPVAVPDTTSYPAGGRGYTSAPTVVIVDVNGTGANATANMVGDAVSSVVMTSGGSGYSANPVVSFTGGGVNPTQGIGANAVGRATVVNGVITGISLVGSDYYEIELGEYMEQLHPDLPPTTLRGYRQVNMGGTPFQSLGPTIVSRRDVPVRIKFVNNLPTGADGDLFIPVDSTVMGAGHGDLGGSELYTENRATLHLHGGVTPWISDGTPFQWTTPEGEGTSYPQGVSVYNVPDMPDWGPNPRQGVLTFYYTNQQSARLQFYHDHAHGITRLNVYAGEAAPYLITDQVEKDMIEGTDLSGVNPTNLKVLPDVGIPLILQDKTFVDASTIYAQDPTWNWGTGPSGTAVTGDLWYPHVYVPAQNPWAVDGVNPFGRWPFGPWFWPPTNVPFGPVANPYFGTNTLEPPEIPGVPNPSMAMEAFMDTSVVNGEAYPYLDVEPRAYRFRILNGADDRFYNLQLYVANTTDYLANGFPTEMSMVNASVCAPLPANWPVDGRAGGVPDPSTVGPNFIHIGTEGGFLPEPVEVPNQPITWVNDPTVFNAGNVDQHALLIAPAERADVIVDFSQYAGKTLILYNDAPAAFPALDGRYDYYTDHPDLTDTGGAPTTQAGYGPNTRTVLQIRVGTTAGTATPDVTLANLKAVFANTTGKRGVFEVSQDPIISSQAGYNSAYNGAFPDDNYVRIHDKSYTFKTLAGNTVTIPITSKAIQDEQGEAYDEYGRLSGFMGLQVERAPGQQQLLLYGYESPPIDILADATGTKIGEIGDGTQIWKITHNGVDTHPIHWHLVNVQLINRVGWDGIVRAPDATELGWKETLRVSPLEDTIVAIRPVSPWLPWDLPNSVRPIDPTEPLGATVSGDPGRQATLFDTSGERVTVTNKLVNYGWEYVFHCHILAHEEMDMMHALLFATPPKVPSNLTATRLGGAAGVQLNWRDNAAGETGFVIQRATDPAFTAGLTTFTVGADVSTYTDSTAGPQGTFYYRVQATNTVGDTTTYAAPAVGFPTKTMNSGWSNTASSSGGTSPMAPVANFTMSRTSGTAPLFVRFTDTSTGNPTSWRWDIAGRWTLQRNPSVIFRTPGTYTVTLTVRNAYGTSSISKQLIVSARPGARDSTNTTGEPIEIVG
jgi:FtsP/CotA-like multicopper oxidase with cupredoxin domain